jgi:hypothetical protein
MLVLVSVGGVVYAASCLLFGAFRLADIRGLVRRAPG